MGEFDPAVMFLKKSVAEAITDGETTFTIRIEEIEQMFDLPHLDSIDQSQFKHEPLTGSSEVIEMFDIDHGNR